MWRGQGTRPQSPRLEAAAPGHGCFCLWPVALPLAALPGSLLSCIPQAFPSRPWHSSLGPPIKPQPSSSVSASACQVGGKRQASVLKGGEGVTAAALEGVVGVFEGLAELFASELPLVTVNSPGSQNSRLFQQLAQAQVFSSDCCFQTADRGPSPDTSFGDLDKQGLGGNACPFLQGARLHLSCVSAEVHEVFQAPRSRVSGGRDPRLTVLPACCWAWCVGPLGSGRGETLMERERGNGWVNKK